MNIYEAIKISTYIKRKSDSTWLDMDGNNNSRYLELDDFKADDWEAKEQEITITRSKVVKAWNNNLYANNSTLESFLKELGFNELKEEQNENNSD